MSTLPTALDQSLLTVSVGIPAHNEESSLPQLLASIVSQKLDRGILERVYIVTDGCTDRTAEVTREWMQRDARVVLLDDGKRMGKSGRLNQLYQVCTSDILVTLDADTALSGDRVIDNLLAPFADPEVGVVAGNDQPLPARTWLERILVARTAWWYQVRRDFNGGDNLENSSGRCYALRQSFMKRCFFAPGALQDFQIIYYFTRELGQRFVFAENARTYFREAAYWPELLARAKRYNYRDDLSPYHFTFDIQSIPQIPFLRKLSLLAQCALSHPLLISSAAVLTVLLMLLASEPKDPELHKKGLWETSESTKESMSEEKA